MVRCHRGRRWRPETFLGGDNCLHYYAYRKMIAVKNNVCYIIFFGGGRGDKEQICGAAAPRSPSD